MGLIVENVSKNFGEKKAVDNISFEISKPRTFCITWNKWSWKNHYYKNDVRHSKKR